MIDDKGRFIIEDYGMKSTFSSFLPGISGKRGIPIWSFYVNRGQGICSFGTEDKEHSIMEFYPAQQAYQNTPTNGFRTFIKVDNQYYEPFREVGSGKTKMYLGKNEMEIQEINEDLKIQVNVVYYTLPGEFLGGLVRMVQIKNLDSRERKISYLDGMPALLPDGVSLTNMKEMGQTVKAWMIVEDANTGIPYYKVRASIKDSTIVTKTDCGHFYLTVDEKGYRIPAIVDPEVVFSYDTSWNKAVGFMNSDLSDLYKNEQMTSNQLPCGFFGKSLQLRGGEAVNQSSVIGKTDNKEILFELEKKLINSNYFQEKREEAEALTNEICSDIQTKTAFRKFDLYCEQTYLDNVLRGGYPIIIGKNKIFYIYGRKHGDIERDYNFFSILPEFYSQGNGNFRDINQNRRCDIQFNLYVKDKNIKDFYNLIQMDGYNPLIIQKTTYEIGQERRNLVLKHVTEKHKEYVKKFLEESFSPGSLEGFLCKEQIILSIKKEDFLEKVMELAEEHMNSDFGEGYWTDHWTYNLDLIESYLKIYPDDEKRLLFQDCTYTYFKAKAAIRPREERYVMTDWGVRQHNAIDHNLSNENECPYLQSEYGKGKVYTSCLIAKLVLLSVQKFSALDSYGMGIEMEGGKPGWYDALNGLPAMFGSSMAETYELYRMIQFIQDMLNKYQDEVNLPFELFEMMKKIDKLLKEFSRDNNVNAHFIFWNRVNEIKESFRIETLKGISGQNEKVKSVVLLQILKAYQEFVKLGIIKALSYGNGICPTYFAYELEEYEILQSGIKPRGFKLILMPNFLEGPVKFFKLEDIENNKNSKQDMYIKIKNSSLYDRKLKMYKVNESLEKASFQIGRAKAFTPGWLENESIWLHMEYKYLLELLRSGLYVEYMKDFKNACIPFLDENKYGRSILENSSFIASSVNPNEKIHGKGFVARLSGSTVEFLHMWQSMMFGENPFRVEENVLTLSFSPMIPDYLIGEDKCIMVTFLGQIAVSYQITSRISVIPDQYEIVEQNLTFHNGDIKNIRGSILVGPDALAVREGKVKSISVSIQN